MNIWSNEFFCNSCKRSTSTRNLIWESESASACLPWAPRLRIWDTVCFSTVIGPVFSYQPSAVKSFTSLKLCNISPRHPPDSGTVTPPKIHLFSSLFPGQQKTENCSQGFQKTTRIQTAINNKRFMAIWFLQYLPSENLFCGAPVV